MWAAASRARSLHSLHNASVPTRQSQQQIPTGSLAGHRPLGPLSIDPGGMPLTYFWGPGDGDLRA